MILSTRSARLTGSPSRRSERLSGERVTFSRRSATLSAERVDASSGSEV
jgi:hypothetical protein